MLPEPGAIRPRDKERYEMESRMQARIEKPRGILNFKEGGKKFQLSRYLPAQDLSLFVEHYWIVSWDLRGQEPYVQETLPHPCVHLVIEQGQSRIQGVETGRFKRLLEGRGQAFGIKFKPGGFYPFVRSPISRFTNAVISLRDVFGVEARALEEMHFSQKSEAEMIELAEGFLREMLPQPDENIRVINRIVDYIIAHQEITKVDDIVSQFNLNKRTLQRLFRQYVGVSPKWVIKRYRLHEVAERLAGGERIDWPGIIVELGYSDQSHFINDFKGVIGRTPAEYVKSLTPSFSK